MTPEYVQGADGFNGLGIAPKLLDILGQEGFTDPTPIQARSIPVTVEGKDIVGIAQTGTGKTLAFGVPMIQRLAQIGGQGLAILPTRELAFQVNDDLKRIGKHIGLRSAVLVGGEAKGGQMNDLKKKPHVIVATPGRLIDYLQSGVVKLDKVKVLVLDEADMMFDMGFMPQVRTILAEVPKDRQTMLFSATMPPEIIKIVDQFMRLPVRIEVAPSGTPAELVDHEMVVMNNDDKLPQLMKVLADFNGSVLIFCRTKHGVRKLTRKIIQMGHNVAEIHSNRSLGQRREALEGFKLGRYRVLVATDIAARGIDVKGIELVLNYDLPEQAEDYVHRIGRTGRAGMAGRAISFALPSQMSEIAQIERLVNQSIPRTLMAEPPAPLRRSFGSGRRGSAPVGKPSNIGTVLKRKDDKRPVVRKQPDAAKAALSGLDNMFPSKSDMRRLRAQREQAKPSIMKGLDKATFVKSDVLDEFGLSDLPFVESDVSQFYPKKEEPKQGSGNRDRHDRGGRDRSRSHRGGRSRSRGHRGGRDRGRGR